MGTAVKKLLAVLSCVVLSASPACAPAAGQQDGQNAALAERAPAPGGTTYTNSIGMEFVLVPAGSFLLELEAGEVKEKPCRPRVSISKPFYLGKHEVTQEQWIAVMGRQPAHVQDRRNPVTGVSWDDAQEFIRRLNAREKRGRYRLPTEMEWEYAARGGTDTMFFFMKDPKTGEEAEKPLADYAWFEKNSGGATRPVGQKKPNSYGLYDIYGNVYEWVQDYVGNPPTDREIKDYRGPAQGAVRMSCGGCWDSDAMNCRSGGRNSDSPDARYSYVGLRLALSAE
jgi:formylglycine-generating enzyme required for sulfatase activity